MMPLKQRKAVQQRVRREAMMFIPPSNPRVDDLNAELERCKQELIEGMRIPEHLVPREEVVQPGVVRRKVP
jgi:hypothetical protein